MNLADRSWVEIDLDAFRSNLRALAALLEPDQGFMQIVKADAYGHGALEIGRVAVEEGAVALGVANAEEGKLLRIQGCKSPILILSPSLESEAQDIVEYDLASSLSDIAFARALQDAAALKNSRAKVHIKIDSGMHRSGIEPHSLSKLWNETSQLNNLQIDGLFSHLASSESDTVLSQRQIAEFEAAVAPYRDQVSYIHIANSSAMVNGLSGSGNLARWGILSFGVYTHPEQPDKMALKPVMSFKSHIAQIKSIPAGDGLGYNHTWIAPRNSLYGVIPVGYADGYDFLLSNRGYALIAGKLCPVIGRVSMDMICVDTTELDDLQVGDSVSLMGQGDPSLRAEVLAASYQGSAYELLCQIGRRARRYYFENGKLSHSAPLARRDFVSSDFSDSKLNLIIQSAISQRLRSDEIGELISREILRIFFFNKDQDIPYRKDFIHHIRFLESGRDHHWQAITSLSFKKVLQNDYFIVACATSDEALRRYFKRKDVEYRWLMDDSFALDEKDFELTEVYINDVRLDVTLSRSNSCLELRCHHPRLKELTGSEVEYRINTISYYPKTAHQLSVFINEITHGVQVSLQYPAEIDHIEVVPVFSGQNRFPHIERRKNQVIVSTKGDQWVFPVSGVVFAY